VLGVEILLELLERELVSGFKSLVFLPIFLDGVVCEVHELVFNVIEVEVGGACADVAFCELVYVHFMRQ
jgi:hypothetical protein